MTISNQEGAKVPAVSFRIRNGNEWQEVDSDDLFAGRNVILFALPGAFTPTCSSTHVPRFNELAPVFAANGIDEIICLSVNDPFVMDAWQQQQGADRIRFLADGNGAFSEAMGTLVDKSDLNFGRRSWRYSMLVRDGVIEKQFIEPEVPGDPFEVSDADTMLNYINPQASAPKRISMISKPGCSHCERARKALHDAGLDFEEIKLGSNGLSLSTLAAVSGATTTPQVFIEGERIGGADDLIALLGQ